MKAEIMIIGLLMMYYNQIISSPPFMSGAAIFTIWLYLALQGVYGSKFSGCIFTSDEPVVPQKKWFFR